MNKKISSYEQQGIDFLKATKTTFATQFKNRGKYFVSDTERRDIYICQLKNERSTYTFRFGQSLENTGKHVAPTAYDVLSTITKYDPGTFEDFCGDFGYDTDSIKAEKIYKDVCKEWEEVSKLFTESELEQLAEIQ